MGHHKARSRSSVSFRTQSSKQYAVDMPGVKRHWYVYKTDTNFGTEFALTSDDLAKFSAFVREFEHCAMSFWLGQHSERRKGRLKALNGPLDMIQPYFGREARVLPEWRLQRLRGWPLLALMRKDRDARQWYVRALKRLGAIDSIRGARQRQHHLRAVERLRSIRAIRRARLKQNALEVRDVPRIGHEAH